MKRKILYTTADASLQSGAFKNLLYMSTEIEKMNYQPVLVLNQDANDTSLLADHRHISFHFTQLPRPKRGQSASYYLRYCAQNIQSIAKLAEIIRRERVDLVHVDGIFDLYGVIAARIARVPCVWHIRSELLPGFVLRSLLPRATLLLSDAIVVVSDSVRQHMFQQQGIYSDKIVVIHDPGPDFAAFHPNIDTAATRGEFGIDRQAFLVIQVAKLSQRKGHATLVRAAPRVLEQFPQTHFMIVGGELEGAHHRSYANHLKALPQELGVQDRVLFAGYRPDIPQIMAAADIVVQGSTYPDPFPGVVLQGMAVGRPVIASNLGGPREQIEDQVSGLLIAPGDPAALAEAICRLLGDEQQRLALGRAAAQRVRSMFTAERFFQRLSDLYESLTSPSRFAHQPQL